MSEKIKGMFGHPERAEEVKNWLKSQGARENGQNCRNTNYIYYIRTDGVVDYVNKTCAELLDIVELPKPLHKFKPFDKVLIRDRTGDPWRCDFYSYNDGELFICIGSVGFECIPYEGNEHLVGTSNSHTKED